MFNSGSNAVNRHINRSGTLFEDRFKSKLIEDAAYLLHLCRYIHRNPIDTDPPLVSKIEDWPWSNYLEWIGKRDGSLVDRNFISESFSSVDEDVEFINDTPSLKVIQRLEHYTFG